jgi:hypothetical protein
LREYSLSKEDTARNHNEQIMILREHTMKIRAVILSAILLLPLPMLADSVTTYTYTGKSFTFVEAPYTTSDSITGYMTLATLGDNYVDVQVNVQSYSFSDGLNSYVGAYSQIANVSTDATGALDGWVIQLGSFGNGPFCTIEGGNSPHAPQSGDECSLSAQGPSANNRDSGNWTMVTFETPEPSSLVLMTTALLASGVAARKRLLQGAF